MIEDVIWMSLSGLLAAILPFLFARLGWLKSAYVFLGLLLALSLGGVQAFTKAGPGPLLWFFVPFWSGWLVALVAILVFATPSRKIA